FVIPIVVIILFLIPIFMYGLMPVTTADDYFIYFYVNDNYFYYDLNLIGLIIFYIGIYFFSIVAFNIVYLIYLTLFRDHNRKVNVFDDQLDIIKKGYLGKFLILTLQYYGMLLLWSLLFIIPGIIKSFSYAQAFLVFKDKMERNEDFKPISCITESREIMNGYKMDLFILMLSFIGWSILAWITFIGYLWLIPYQQMALVAFYENIKDLNHDKLATEEIVIDTIKKNTNQNDYQNRGPEL
ncbi:DUF975 family protein, partial [Erysipelotrichaceae bacterium OttesenSCG-928-M19]|nr:DUF975 family protein [Erysipelotrichaceae bacterium OttesenSCG-928-M19]